MLSEIDIFEVMETIIEARNWLLVLLGSAGTFIGVRTFISSIKQRRIDNTYKTIDFIRKHISEEQINTFINLFHANNFLSGVEKNEFKFPDGRTDTVENMLSEGGCGNGDIQNMIELFTLLTPTFKNLEENIIWYEYGQIMSGLYHWTEQLEESERRDNIYPVENLFCYKFNIYMRSKNLDRLKLPVKFYTYLE